MFRGGYTFFLSRQISCSRIVTICPRVTYHRQPCMRSRRRIRPRSVPGYNRQPLRPGLNRNRSFRSVILDPNQSPSRHLRHDQQSEPTPPSGCTMYKFHRGKDKVQRPPVRSCENQFSILQTPERSWQVLVHKAAQFVSMEYPYLRLSIIKQ